MTQHVLFLCTGNYYRSRFAEELFNHCARQNRLDWTASSRGLALERGSSNIGPISPHTRDALSDRNINPLGGDRLPEACTLDDFTRADMVIALDETEHRELLQTRFSGWDNRVIYWSIHDVAVTNPADAIASIELETTRLIKQLQSGLVSSG